MVVTDQAQHVYLQFIAFSVALLMAHCGASSIGTTSIGSWSSNLVFPPSRSKHIAVAWAADAVFLSAGRGNSGVYLSDSWSYNLTTGLWQRISLYGTARPSMELAAFASVGSDVFIFGGINVNLDVPVSSDLYAVNMIDYSQRLVPTVGDIPGPRQSGCAVGINGGFVLLFGSAATMIDKHFYYLAASSTWRMIPSSSPAPPGRELPCCAKVNATALACFGGVIVADLADLWLLDLTTWLWTNLTSAHPLYNVSWPFPRNGHQCFGDASTSSFVIAGGFSQQMYSSGVAGLRDIWAFSLTTMSWTMTDSGHGVPPFDTVPTVDTGYHALVFGGWAPLEMLNSIYEFARPTFTWKLLQPQTYWPSPRFLNCFTPVGSSFHALFGSDGTNLLADSWWTYSPNLLQRWQQQQISLVPRAGASCTLHTTVIVVLFGSFDASFSDIRSTVELVYPYAQPPFSRVVTPVDGISPSPRSEHGAARRGAQIYIFGGRDSAGDALSDLWRFDVTLLRWTQLVPVGSAPSGRIAMGFVTTAMGFLMISGYDGTYYPPDRWSLQVSETSSLVKWAQLHDTTIDPQLAAYQLRWRSVSFTTAAAAHSVFSFSGEPVPYDYRQSLLFVNGSQAVGLAVGPDIATYGACGGGVIGRTFHSFGGLSTLPRLRLQSTPSSALQTYMLSTICQPPISDVYGNCSLCADGSTGAACDPCATGKYFDVTSRLCVPCPAGTFGVDSGLVGSSSCLPCASGTFSARSGSTACVACNSSALCPIGSSSQNFGSAATSLLFSNVTSNNQPSDWTVDPAMSVVNTALLIIGVTTVVIVMLLLIGAKCREHIRRRNALCNEVCVAKLRTMFEIICLGSDELQREHLYGLCRAIATPMSEVPSEVHLFTMSLYFDSSGNNTVRFDEFMDLLVYLMENENFKVDWTLLGVDEENAKAMEAHLREVQQQWLEDDSKRAFKSRPTRPFSLASFDIFGDAHGAEDEVSFMRSRKTAAGGACAILFYVMCAIILVLFLATYFYDNTIETKSSVPSIMLPIDVGLVTSTVSLGLTLTQVPNSLACNCSDALIVGMGVTFSERSRTCVFDPAASLCVLTAIFDTFHVVTVEGSVTVTFTNPHISASGILLNVAASASAQDLSRQSTIQIGLVLDQSVKSVLRGLAAPTVFDLSFYPTVTIVNGIGSPGYHIDATAASTGSLNSNFDFATSAGLQVVVRITNVLSSSLIVDFEINMTWLNLLSQISGSISGISPILLLFMAIIESLISLVEGCLFEGGTSAQRNEKLRRKTQRFSTQFGIDDENRCSKALPNVSEENRVMLELVFDGMPYRAAKRLAELLSQHHLSDAAPHGEQEPAPQMPAF